MRHSPNYKRTVHPAINRIRLFWKLLTKRNIILIHYTEITDEAKGKGRKVTVCRSTVYDKESELLTLDAAYLIVEKSKA